MSRYKFRSRDLVDIINDINSGILILSPYFQRNLVWRLAHKIDFIKTILKGYPFPEIFISRGTIDVDTMRSTSCIVDGQQRMSSIREFIEGSFDVDGRFYSDLDNKEKESFLKYEIAIVDLELYQDDAAIKEIFQRLNRTFYALSSIEKLSTEYGSSDYMLIAKLLCGELKDDNDSEENVDPRSHKSDPNITKEFTLWSNGKDISEYFKYILESSIFTKYEISRQVHLMYTLNIMSTFMLGIYGRNDQVIPQLNTYSNDFNERDDILGRLANATEYFNRIKFPSTSAWLSKSNAFSLLIIIDRNYDVISQVSIRKIKNTLVEFSNKIPEDYALAAREAVNNKKQRLIRDGYLKNLINGLL